MKKLLVGLAGLLFGSILIAHAGTPRETFYQGQAPLSHASIMGSTATLVGTASLTTSVPATTVNGTGCRICYTKFYVQIPTTTIITILDGGTTVQTIDGLGLGASGVNSAQLVEDHLGPLCLTAGNASTLNLIPTAGISTAHQVMNYEGYTSCGGTNNAGN